MKGLVKRFTLWMGGLFQTEFAEPIMAAVKQLMTMIQFKVRLVCI